MAHQTKRRTTFDRDRTGHLLVDTSLWSLCLLVGLLLGVAVLLSSCTVYPVAPAPAYPAPAYVEPHYAQPYYYPRYYPRYYYYGPAYGFYGRRYGCRYRCW